MIDTHQRLEAYIRGRLSESDSCRVFEEMLMHCWSMPMVRQEQEIAAFADKYGWKATVHKLRNIGRVADFQRK